MINIEFSEQELQLIVSCLAKSDPFWVYWASNVIAKIQKSYDESKKSKDVTNQTE